MKTLYNYQRQTEHKAFKSNLFIAFEPGLGKTVTAIELGKDIMASPALINASAVLVICPKRLRLQWISMIQEQDPITPITLIETGMVFKGRELSGWVVSHYEAVVDTQKYLRQRVWGLVIVDEAHHIKNRKALRTKAVRSIEAIRKVALSAVPMDRSPAELWSVLNWMFPNTYRSYWNFIEKYCSMEAVPPWLTGGKYAGASKIVGTKNELQLVDELSPFFIRYTKQQVAPELPPKTVTKVPVEMYPEQEALYNKIAKAKDIVVDEIIIPNILARITRLQQVTSDPSAAGFGTMPSAKCDWVAEYLEDNPEIAVVIFTRFRATAKALAARFECEYIVGGTEEWPEFLDGRNRVITGTIAAMGEGIDGLQRADVAIFVDQEWSTALMTNAMDRIHRLGIQAPKQIIHLYCPHTKDELVLRALDEKWTNQQLVYHYLEQEGIDVNRSTD
jgi:SNF2 family DNA or RNA helicase